jgi:hypothetical protein
VLLQGHKLHAFFLQETHWKFTGPFLSPLFCAVCDTGQLDSCAGANVLGKKYSRFS